MDATSNPRAPVTHPKNPAVLWGQKRLHTHFFYLGINLPIYTGHLLP